MDRKSPMNVTGLDDKVSKISQLWKPNGQVK
jgi:hypothetical protein